MKHTLLLLPLFLFGFCSRPPAVPDPISQACEQQLLRELAQ